MILDDLRNNPAIKDKIYYQNENGILFNADCMDIMKHIPDKSINLVLTDPPYGIGADNGVGGGVFKGRKYKGDWDIKPQEEIFNFILKISINAIIFGGNFFTDLLPCGNHWIVWDKTGEIHFNNPYSGAELAWTNFLKNTVKKYVCIQAGFIAEEKDRFHPTQKPVRIFENIIKDYSEINKTIFDPFLGSGTTAVACERLGRKWVGVELEPEYCEIAKTRILAEYNQIKMF